MLTDQQNYSRPDEMRDHDKLHIRWLLLIAVLGVLIFLDWGFVYVYCEPQPGYLQSAVFFGLLALIFFETIDAGFYTSDDS